MSEHSWLEPTPLTPEQIENEELWLLDLQAEHAKVLETQGIAAKAKATLSPTDAAKITALSRPSISLSREAVSDDTVAEVVRVRFATPDITPTGTDTTNFVYAPVVKAVDRAIEAQPGFTLSDAETVLNMATGLKQARELGVLPHLSEDLASITNPFHFIIMPTRPNRA